MSFDAIIVGAGPAGCCAALALAQQGRSVAIVERSAFPRQKVCGEFMSAVNMPILDRLGVGADVRMLAGPEVTRLALFASGPSIEAPMPRATGDAFGRALGRDVFDAMLLDAARAAGVAVFQPWRATAVASLGDAGSRVRIETRVDAQDIVAPVVIAAHGSWEPGKLVTNLEKRHERHDFLGFKAHFRGASLALDLMPLLVFPGGYGGMVWADAGRLSLSCCIRRDILENLRKRHGGSAADAVHAHIVASCPAVAAALDGASLIGEWLAAGPIRPGMRNVYGDDIFKVGNLAGESHPIIAEGISMALQSGWMVARELGRFQKWGPCERAAAGQYYSAGWKQQFSTRIRVASVLARLAIFPMTAHAMRTFVRAFPMSLSVGAVLSGKTRTIAAIQNSA
jgi:flavin-dependent dehydrogenase